MTTEYARLDLLREVQTKDGKNCKEVVVFRPTCRDMTTIVAHPRTSEQLAEFIGRCCRAVNGTGVLSDFTAGDLDVADGSELASLIVAMTDESDAVRAEVVGDGISEPIVYTLQYPIKLTPDAPDTEAIRQISFEARKIGDLADFLDSRGAGDEFYAFMRGFGTLLGTELPMTDSIIGALDFVDYLVIRRVVMGKLVTPRKRWRRTST